MSDFIERIGLALVESDAPARHRWHAGWLKTIKRLCLPAPAGRRETVDLSRRPQVPKLVPPAQVPQRKLGTTEGERVNSRDFPHRVQRYQPGADAAYRFVGLPSEYYAEWVRIAGEEALLFFTSETTK